MFKKGKNVRHDHNEEFKRLSFEIQKNYPNDPIKQIKEWEKQESQFKLLGVAEVVQLQLAMPTSKVEVDSAQLDLLYRAIIDLTAHLQENLPDGVYDYNYGNIRGVSSYILETMQTNKQNV